MRRFVIGLGLVLVGVAIVWAADAALRAAVLPKLERRLGAKVTVDKLRPAWPPGLALVGVRTRGDSPLVRADEIVVRLDEVVLRGGVVRLRPREAARRGEEAARMEAPSDGGLRLRAEDCTVDAVWQQGWVSARGVSARPRAGGWRVTARSVRLGRDGLAVETGPAAADVTAQRSWSRIVATGTSVEAYGLRVGPLLLRARDGWSPAGPEIELVLPQDEARIDGERLRARVSGSVALRLPPDGPAALRATLDLRDAEFRHPAVASRPVSWPAASVALEASLDAAAVRVDRLAMGAGAWAIEGRGAWTPARAEAEVEIASPDCAAALRSLPDGLAPVVAGMRLAGALRGRVRFAFESAKPQDATLDVSFPALCRVLGDSPAAPMSRVGRDVAPLRSYGRHVPAAFQVAEDLRFWEHDGFDLEQIRRALVHDLEERAFARGASTISQQVVKNLFLSHERTLSRKLEEAVLTWRMERVVDKRRILEAYLDLVELGPGVRGVEAAARTYFGVGARDLDPLQAVHLAALTPAPVRLSRAAAAGVSRAWRARLDELLDFMRHQRLLSPSDWLRARGRRLTIRSAEAGGEAGAKLSRNDPK